MSTLRVSQATYVTKEPRRPGLSAVAPEKETPDMIKSVNVVSIDYSYSAHSYNAQGYSAYRYDARVQL